MRPRPASQVVKTDEEIRAEMKADANVTKAEIAAVMDERRANAEAAQEAYRKKTSAPFIASLNDRSTGATPSTIWDKE